MEKMKKKSIFFGAALVSIFLVFGATGTAVTQIKEISKVKTGISTTCVEPGIYISGSEQRKILSDSLCYIDEPNAHRLIQAILAVMDLKSFVNSKDLEQIIIENNLEFSLVAGIGAPITTGAYPNPGYALRVGHPLQSSGTVLFGLLFWNAKHSLNPARDINITITLSGLQLIVVDDKLGLSVGFSGTFARGEEETGKWFTLQGSALLHLVY